MVFCFTWIFMLWWDHNFYNNSECGSEKLKTCCCFYLLKFNRLSFILQYIVVEITEAVHTMYLRVSCMLMYFLWIFICIFCCNCFILSNWIHFLGLHCVFCLWKLLWCFMLKTLRFGWKNLLDCGCNFDQGCVQLLDKWKGLCRGIALPKWHTVSASTWLC